MMHCDGKLEGAHFDRGVLRQDPDATHAYHFLYETLLLYMFCLTKYTVAHT